MKRFFFLVSQTGKVLVDDGCYSFWMMHVKVMGAVDRFVIFVRSALFPVNGFEFFDKFDRLVQWTLFGFDDFQMTFQTFYYLTLFINPETHDGRQHLLETNCYFELSL